MAVGPKSRVPLGMEGLLIEDKNNGGCSALEPAAVLNEQGDNQDCGENPNDLHGRNIQTNFAAWGERTQFKFGVGTKALCTTLYGTAQGKLGCPLVATVWSPHGPPGRNTVRRCSSMRRRSTPSPHGAGQQWVEAQTAACSLRKGWTFGSLTCTRDLYWPSGPPAVASAFRGTRTGRCAYGQRKVAVWTCNTLAPRRSGRSGTSHPTLTA